MKTKIVILFAVLAILFGLYGLAGNMQTPKVITETVAEIQKERMVKVWFVKQSVQPGQLVERSQLELKLLPESEANLLAVTDDVVLPFESRSVYNRDIVAGSTLFPEDLTHSDDVNFIDLVIATDRVPFAIEVDESDIIGGAINFDSYVDILALASGGSKLSLSSDELNTPQFKSVSVSPVLTNIRVLQVQRRVTSTGKSKQSVEQTHLVLELSRKEVAIMTVAKRIAELQVHKSIGNYKHSELAADAGDVLADFKAVKEFRADEISIK